MEPLNNRHVDVGEVVSSEVRELVHQSFIRSSTVYHSELKMEFLLTEWMIFASYNAWT